MTLSPNIVRLEAYPGGLERFTVNVNNTGDRALSCTIAINAMKIKSGGLPVPAKEAPRSCKDWLTVEPSRFQLGAQESRRVLCRLECPADATGGYYAILDLRGKPENLEGPSRGGEGIRAGLRLSYRTMAPILATVPGGRIRAVIDAGRPTVKKIDKGGGYLFRVPARNRGNVHARMHGTLEVRSRAGQVLKSFSLEAGRGFILPSHKRIFRCKTNINLPDGLYIARIVLKTEKFRRPMQKKFGFHVQQGQPSFSKVSKETTKRIREQSAGFTVSPARSRVILPTGGRRVKAIKLTNLKDHTVTVIARALEWSRSATGRNLVVTRKPAHERSASKYVKLRKQEINLRPHGKRRVPVIISLPKDVKGELYAALCFDRKKIKLDASPTARARRSALLSVSARGTLTQKAKARAFTAERQPNGVVDLKARIENRGNARIRPEAIFFIENEQGEGVGKISPKNRPRSILAGMQSVVSAKWKQVLDPGTYRAGLSLRYSPDKPPLTARTEFTVPQPSGATSSAGKSTGTQQ